MGMPASRNSRARKPPASVQAMCGTNRPRSRFLAISTAWRSVPPGPSVPTISSTGIGSVMRLCAGRHARRAFGREVAFQFQNGLLEITAGDGRDGVTKGADRGPTDGDEGESAQRNVEIHKTGADQIER